MLNETPALAPDGQPYRLLTLRNSAGMVVTLMDWGATLLPPVYRCLTAAFGKHYWAAPARNTTLNRRRSSAPLLAVTRTVSPIAAIRLPAKPYS